VLQEQRARIGVLWRGDRRVESAPRADRGLGALYAAFTHLPVDLEMVPYGDDAVDEARSLLLALDGVLVWVNPIQDGHDRGRLDRLLREVSARGVWVSAHPDVAAAMGTKEVLYRTRHLGWGSDIALYRSAADFAAGFPRRLARFGRLVVKQARGNGGNGVWRVELPDGAPGPADPDTLVRVRHAQMTETAELVDLRSFMTRCEPYFAWSGCLVDQPFAARLADGLLRCYLTRGRVVGFCHQWPSALLDEDAPQRRVPPPVMEGRETLAYQRVRSLLEASWIPQMRQVLGLREHDLPVIWDADLLYGPVDATGADTYVLCEINVSAVWPFPAVAAPTVVAAALDGVRSRPGGAGLGRAR
jgi:hypothetical protein